MVRPIDGQTPVVWLKKRTPVGELDESTFYLMVVYDMMSCIKFNNR